MAQYLRQYSSIKEAEIKINGGVVGGKDMRKTSQYFVHGLTLVCTGAFAGTITFAATPASAQVPMTLKQIISQIESQSSNGLTAGLMPETGALYIIDAGVPAVAVVLGVTSTGLAALGFDKAGVTGKFYNTSGGAAPRVLNVFTAPDNGGRVIALTEET